jgi:tetratricopeptide (TPR) repeat protein
VDKALYPFLKWTAIVLGCGFLGWAFYDSFVAERGPGDTVFLDAETLFEDGFYERALEKYEEALREQPDHYDALRGRATSLGQLGRFSEALRDYTEVLARDPEDAGVYANRGIVYDRMGEHEKAAEDYEHALTLDPRLAEGPHWLIRFLRLQPDKPPTIADRARYIRQQLAKPPGERVLKLPEIDAAQRAYKQ